MANTVCNEKKNGNRLVNTNTLQIRLYMVHIRVVQDPKKQAKLYSKIIRTLNCFSENKPYCSNQYSFRCVSIQPVKMHFGPPHYILSLTQQTISIY